jgi:hypothetical protein
MMSKALKNTPRSIALREKEKEPTRWGRFLSRVSYLWLMYVYYPVRQPFFRYSERIGRSFAFAKHGWMHYDFESAYLYDIMAFKLKRIHATLLTGHAVQYPKDMNALKEAIKICERLFKGDYEWKYHRKHDKKWGKIRTKTTPIYSDDGKVKHYTWTSSRGKANTKKQKELERKEFLQCWTLGEIDRKADLDRLNEILKKHEPSWWD